MLEAVRVEAVDGDKRRREVACLKPRQKLAASRDHMRDVGNEAAVLDSHEDRVCERAAFDAEFHAFEISKPGNRLCCGTVAKYDRQPGKMIGLGRDQGADLRGGQLQCDGD